MFHLLEPCKNCPFRKEPQFRLGTTRRREIAESLEDDWNTFPCHKTTTFTDVGNYQPNPREQHCAGAMLVLEKQHRPNIPMRFARMQGKYHPAQLRGWDNVYDSLDDFAIAEDRESAR